MVWIMVIVSHAFQIDTQLNWFMPIVAGHGFTFKSSALHS